MNATPRSDGFDADERLDEGKDEASVALAPITVNRNEALEEGPKSA
jgi:hypothetical protein